MSEQHTYVRTVRVNYTCDKCRFGIMVPTGNAAARFNGSDYEHECSTCGHVQDFPCRYPRIEYEEIHDEGEE